MGSDVDDFDTDEGDIDDQSNFTQNISTNTSSSSNDDDLRGLVGLQNLGNTCYMNGALQALSNCQQLTRFVLDCPGFMKKTGLSRSYSELIKEIWDSKSSQYAVPTSIIRNIKCIYPAFRGCSQQDTQEFLRCFLEQLHDELKQPPVRCKDSTDKRSNSIFYPEEESCHASNSTSTSSSTDARTNHDGQEQASNTCTPCDDSQRSIISDTFEFKVSSSVVCSNCNNISTTKETFKDLSIPIPSRDHPYYQTYNDQVVSQESSEFKRLQTSDTRSVVNEKQTLPETSESSDDISSSEKLSEKVSAQRTKAQLDNQVDYETERQEIQQAHSLNPMPIARWLFSWFGQLSNLFWGPQVTLNDCLSIFFGTDPLEGDNEYSCEVCTKKNKGVKYLKILELPEVLCIHFKRYESVGSAKITTHVSFPIVGLDLAPFMSDDCRPQCTTYNLIACICHHGSALLNGHYTTYALNCYDDQWYEFDDQYVNCVSSYQVENSEAYILFYQKSTLDDKTEKQRVKASKLLKKSLRSKDINKYFISKQWVNKFNTFVEPGPVTNYDFLCEHEKVPRSKQANVDELCHPISEIVWKYLISLHGGGPECRELVSCEDCT